MQKECFKQKPEKKKQNIFGALYRRRLNSHKKYPEKHQS